MYEVILSREGAKTLEKATVAARRRIIAALERVKTNPHCGKRLRGELGGLFSLIYKK
jgi:mRNA-degrading endonuclease RelE of RelBE toxin-antitoxin system